MGGCRLLMLSCLVLLSGAAAATGVEEVRYPLSSADHRDVRDDYALNLLQLALDRSSSRYGPYRLLPAEEITASSRNFLELESGNLDLLWTMTSPEREQRARAIPIPLYKGLMGYRALMVRREDLDWFRQVRSLDPLREILAGQGHDWVDGPIFEANGLPVVHASDYESLFHMLEQGRFDYLNRAVIEAFTELERRPELDLAVVPDLVLHYPIATLFFVARDNTRLAERLEYGLEAARRDGSFDRLLLNHPHFQDAFRMLRDPDLMILELKNPYRTPAMRLERHDLWLHPKDLPAPVTEHPTDAH